jgi:hypothetical protein
LAIVKKRRGFSLGRLPRQPWGQELGHGCVGQGFAGSARFVLSPAANSVPSGLNEHSCYQLQFSGCTL